MLIGPEPTTDRFEIVSYGKEDGKVNAFNKHERIMLTLESSHFTHGVYAYP